MCTYYCYLELFASWTGKVIFSSLRQTFCATSKLLILFSIFSFVHLCILEKLEKHVTWAIIFNVQLHFQVWLHNFQKRMGILTDVPKCHKNFSTVIHEIHETRLAWSYLREKWKQNSKSSQRNGEITLLLSLPRTL